MSAVKSRKVMKYFVGLIVVGLVLMLMPLSSLFGVEPTVDCPYTVDLATKHPDQIGFDSSWPNGDSRRVGVPEEGDCGGLTDPVVWHFTLTGLDGGTPAGTLSVNFQNDGPKTATGIPNPSGNQQHFWLHAFDGKNTVLWMN